MPAGGATSAGDCGDLTVRGLIGADVARQARQHWPNAGGVLLANRVAAGCAQLVELRVGPLPSVDTYVADQATFGGGYPALCVQPPHLHGPRHQLIQLDIPYINGRLQGLPGSTGRRQAISIRGEGQGTLARRLQPRALLPPGRCGISSPEDTDDFAYRALARLAQIRTRWGNRLDSRDPARLADPRQHLMAAHRVKRQGCSWCCDRRPLPSPAHRAATGHRCRARPCLANIWRSSPTSRT